MKWAAAPSSCHQSWDSNLGRQQQISNAGGKRGRVKEKETNISDRGEDIKVESGSSAASGFITTARDGHPRTLTSEGPRAQMESLHFPQLCTLKS